MLDIKTKSSEQDEPKQEVQRPRPKLEMPPIEPQSNYLTLFSIIAVILVLLTAVGLYVLKSTKASAFKTQEAEMQMLTDQMGSSPLVELDKQITDLQNGLVLFEAAINSEFYWSKMFTELDKTDPKSVKFTAFSVDENGIMKLSGQTADFVNIAKLIRSMENSAMFTDVALVSSTSAETVSGNNINFIITYKIKSSSSKSGTDTSQAEK